jgi:hypothetical protein
VKKGNVLTLTNPGTAQKVKRGTFELPKGKLMPHLLCKLTIPLRNETGGAVTLSEEQRKALLSRFSATMTHGAGGHRKPYNAITLDKLRNLARFALGQDFAGFADTSTGLARELPNGATTSVEVWAAFPTGGLHQLRGRKVWMGVGRSQASTVEIDLKYDTATIIPSVTINGHVVAECVPYTISAKGDRASYFPEYVELVEKDLIARLPEGLPLLLAELSAPHASSQLSNLALHIDGEVVHDNVSAADALVEYEGNPELTGEASITDEVTVLYGVGPGVEWRDLPTGAPRFEQLKKDLGEASLGYYFVPVVPDDKVRADCAEFAKFRNKMLRCSSVATVEGLDLPDRLRFATPWLNLDGDDEEFERVPGLLAVPGSRVVAESIPPSVLEAARAQLRIFTAGGETKRKERVYRQVAAAMPGSVPAARGYSAGNSRPLTEVRRMLGD